MTRELETRLAATWPPEQWRDVTVCLAVSGGADSVALLRAAAALAEREGIRNAGGRLVAAHFNHRLRGEESNADQRFVVELCGRLDIPCEVASEGASGGCQPPGPNAGAGAAGSAAASEETARNRRYDFLRQTAQRLGARFVATAHTADDQVETILHRILRGTGLAGLAGIPRARPLAEGIALVRPMLELSRREVLAYLSELDQAYREDASNLLPRYTRNRLRNELLPRLAAEYNPEVSDALLRLGRLAAEAQVVLEAAAAQLLERAVVARSAQSVTLDRRTFAGQPRYLVREAFVWLWRERDWPRQAFGYAERDALAELALSSLSPNEEAHRTLPGNVRAQARGDALTLFRSGHA